MSQNSVFSRTLASNKRLELIGNAVNSPLEAKELYTILITLSFLDFGFQRFSPKYSSIRCIQLRALNCSRKAWVHEFV
jgi:hypothetical protein